MIPKTIRFHAVVVLDLIFFGFIQMAEMVLREFGQNSKQTGRSMIPDMHFLN